MAGPEQTEMTKRILLFAEDPVMFGLITEYFRQVHPDFTIVNDSAEGMHLQHLPMMAAARKADVVIWDLNKIRLGEVEITWALRFLADRFPVVLITPFGADDTKRRAQALGVASYLSKPFKLSELAAEVQRIVGAAGGASSTSRDRMNSSA